MAKKKTNEKRLVKRKTRSLVAFFSFLALLLIILYSLFSEKKEKEPLSEPSQASFCQKNEDCRLAVRLDRCCTCPEVKTKTEILADPALVTYYSGQDYYSRKTIDCSGTECRPCPLMSGVECVGSSCRSGALSQADLQTISWQTFRQQELGFQIKYPSSSRLFAEKDRFTFRNIDIRQPLNSAGVDSFYLQIFRSGKAGGQSPEGMAQKALGMELELVEKYGGEASECRLGPISRGGLSGFRVDFCSLAKDESPNIPEFTEWYISRGYVLEISGRVAYPPSREVFDLMLATLEFFPG